jgi:phosphatidate cytidylyltransferase
LWGCAVSDTPAKKSDLGVRTLSAVVMLAVSGTALWLGGWWWTVFCGAIAAGVLWEWRGLAYAIASSGLGRAAWMLGGMLYIGIAAAILLHMRHIGTGMLLLVIAAVIATDIGAYFSGRTFGGPKIAPRISPSKTWSGLLGGAALAALICFLAFPISVLSACFNYPVLCRGGISAIIEIAAKNIRYDQAWVFGPITAIIAQTGDFFESWMKRRAGVKDSGNLIPGHGGLFDRLDGLLAVLFVIGVFYFIGAMANQ